MLRPIKILFSVLSLSILALSSVAVAEAKLEKIRFLNWWDYLDPRVVQKIKASGFDLDLTIYKSNESGLSRLVSKASEFDLAIVSNEVLPILLENGLVEDAPKGFAHKGYESFVKPKAGYCVPYLWGSSVFAYDSRKIKDAPSSLADLVALKNRNLRIAADDDPFIISARILGDVDSGCGAWSGSGSIFDSLAECPNAVNKLKSFSFTKLDFRTNLDGFYDEQDAAASYGWHGAVAAYLKKYPWLQFEPAKLNPIIGIDYACILKRKGKVGPTLKRKAAFLSKLTDAESTHWNAESSQYFSPRIGDTVGLNEKVKALRSRIMDSLARSKALIITPPDQQNHRIINSWWQALRYGN